MKKGNMILAGVLVALCVIGWLLMATQKISESSETTNYVKQADEWVEKGLYQRAIASYKSALEQKQTEEIYEKIAIAYQARYEEAPEETLEEYMNFLEGAVSVHPASKTMVDSLLLLYEQESEYKKMYNCLMNAISGGYDTEELQTKLLEVRYVFELRRGEFSGLKQSNGELYTVERSDGWNVYSADSGYLLSTAYEYVGTCSEEGYVVVTGEDSRLIDSSGMVWGIFEKKVTEAGVFSEGLVAAKCDGIYSYYNDFAEKQFGDYEMAGVFQNGKAAVKKDGKWMLVNTKGEKASDTYEEIVLDFNGKYIVNERILVKASDGTYKLYDEDWKEKATLKCDEVDVYTADSLIAVCKDGKWGYMNGSGEMVIDTTYDQAKSFSNGLAAVCRDGLWGFIDVKNNLVIEFQFTDAGYMDSNGMCPVRTDELNDQQEITENNQTTEDVEIVEEEIWKILKLTIGITKG